LTVTDANGCAALLNVTIQNALAQITASSNSPVCAGNTLNLSSGGGVSYSWTGPHSFSSTLQNPSVTQVTSLNSGVYTVTVTGSNNCSSTATTSVSILSNVNYFADADGDGYGDAASTIQSCLTFAGYVTDNTDCNDDPLSNGFNIHPGATEICNNIDDNCNGLIDNLDPGITGQGVFYSDLDGDGYGAGSAIVTCIQPAQTSVNNQDCNDDPNLNGFAFHPGATEICNSIDDNCNGLVDYQDPEVQSSLALITASGNSPVCTGNTLNLSSGGGLSYSWSGPDSFSSTLQNPSVSQVSSLNGGVYTVTVAVSGDCMGTATTTVSVSTNAIYYADADGDGYGDAASTIQSCLTVAGYVTDNTDCNDDPLSNGFNIHPGATEICNNIDDNCNGLIDNLDPGITGQGVYYSDLDGDGYGAGSAILSCDQPAQTSVNNIDCNDDPNLNGFAIHPGVTEICNGVDDNCNGFTDEGCPANVTLNLKLFIQGYYRGNSTMIAAVDPVNYPTLCDTIYVELHQDVSPYNLVYSLKGTINTNGNGTFIFPNTFYSNHYYLTIRHRNALETWSKNTVWFNNSSVNGQYA
jgi:hypothetical protein